MKRPLGLMLSELLNWHLTRSAVDLTRLLEFAEVNISL